MCQLLGMNCNVPTDIRFSFSGFRQRGGRTDCHADGWGIAFFEGAGCRQILDPAPAGDSKLAELVAQAPIRSRNVVAHIRKATQGPVQLENTHPFVRELWGRYWAFAHNGHLEGFEPPDSALRGFRPVGTTDSERAFCFLLSALRASFAEMPPQALLLERIASLTREIADYGSFHYLLSNGDFLLAHSTESLAYVVREAPFGTAHLVDEDLSVDFRALTTPEDRVAVIATTPLTDDETWTPIAPGEPVLFVDGKPAGVGDERELELGHDLRLATARDARFAA